jgi:DNA-binding NtrC family response regulator
MNCSYLRSDILDELYKIFTNDQLALFVTEKAGKAAAAVHDKEFDLIIVDERIKRFGLFNAVMLEFSKKAVVRCFY